MYLYVGCRKINSASVKCSLRMQVENHGVEAALMEEVKSFVYRHYDEHLEKKFYASDLAKNLQLNKDDDDDALADQVDWDLMSTRRWMPWFSLSFTVPTTE